MTDKQTNRESHKYTQTRRQNEKLEDLSVSAAAKTRRQRERDQTDRNRYAAAQLGSEQWPYHTTAGSLKWHESRALEWHSGVVAAVRSCGLGPLATRHCRAAFGNGMITHTRHSELALALIDH